MDQEKQEWMDEVGIKKFDVPVTHYFLDFRGVSIALYTKEYLENTDSRVLEERLNVRRERRGEKPLDVIPSTYEEWRKRMGLKEFLEPQAYYIGSNHLYGREYMERTPLEVLKAKFDRTLIEYGDLIVDDSDFKKEESL